MDPIGTVPQLEARIPSEPLEGPDFERALAILDDVSALARKESGDSSRWDGATAETTAPADVQAVVLAAARRLWMNPDGYASEQDGDYSYRLPAGTLVDGVFTEPERDLLRSYRDSSGLWSLPITGSPSTTKDSNNVLERSYWETFS